jgi:hypothetical protein
MMSKKSDLRCHLDDPSDRNFMSVAELAKKQGVTLKEYFANLKAKTRKSPPKQLMQRICREILMLKRTSDKCGRSYAPTDFVLLPSFLW